MNHQRRTEFMDHISLVFQTSEEFGVALRAQRRMRKLTQAKAAALAGVSTRLWNETERGKRLQIGMETALRMIQTIGFDLGLVTRSHRSTSSPA
jgi:transcriptional regulator with XRE-family HTH domain